MRKSLLCTSTALAVLLAAPAARAVEPSVETFLRGLSPDNIAADLRVVGGQTTNPDNWPWQIYLVVPISVNLNLLMQTSSRQVGRSA